MVLDNIQGVFSFWGNYVSADSFIAFGSLLPILNNYYIDQGLSCAPEALFCPYLVPFVVALKASFHLFVSFGGSYKLISLWRTPPPHWMWISLISLSLRSCSLLTRWSLVLRSSCLAALETFHNVMAGALEGCYDYDSTTMAWEWGA